MMTISIIGRGNVASHLLRAFRDAGFDCDMINPHTLENLRPDRQLYIISVKDDAIADVASNLHNRLADTDMAGSVVAHTSGGTDISLLQEIFGTEAHTGVIYPMQTFTKGIEMKYSDIPFLIEGSDSFSLFVISKAASAVSADVTEADSAMRTDYHVGAVLACNFTNFLFTLSDDYLKSRHLDFRKLLPLIRRTCEKIDSVSPEEAQTGPAVRGDAGVIRRHLDRLSDSPETAGIYRLLTEQIQRHHNSK